MKYFNLLVIMWLKNRHKFNHLGNSSVYGEAEIKKKNNEKENNHNCDNCYQESA